MNGLRLYTRYVGVSLRSQLQYRASVIMQSIGAFLVTVIDFVAILALFARFGQLRGWQLAEVALFYGMISVSFALADSMSRGFEVFGQLVKAGDFDRMLLRPRSTVLQLLGYELTVRRIGRFIQGLAVLVYAVATLDIDWGVARAGLLLGSIAGTICVFMGVIVLQATAAFWTTETMELWNAFTYGGLTASQYPLPIYRRWFSKFLLVGVPVGCTSYLPGIAILGREDPLGTPELAQWLSPLAGVVFLVLALQVWRWGQRRYLSTGS